MYVYDQNGQKVQVTPQQLPKMAFKDSGDGSKKSNKMVWILVVIVILFLLGMAWYLMKKKGAPKMGFAPKQRFGFTFY